MSTSRCSSGLSGATSFMRSPCSTAGTRRGGLPLTSRVRQLSSGRVLAGLEEADAGPALERELQVDARGGEGNERATVIEGEVLEGAGTEFLELLRIRCV